MSSELLKFLMEQLNEKSNFKDVRRVAEQAIQFGMNKSAEAKEEWIFSALSELGSLKDTTLKMKKIILQAIEVVMLSRRISNTKTKNIFSDKINGNSNHIWLMSGAKLLIPSFYPGLNVEFITIEPDVELDLLSIVEQLKLHSSIWIIVGYSKNYHLSLMRLQLNEDQLQIQVLDSVGAIPNQFSCSQIDAFDRKLSHLVSSIISTVDPVTHTITATSDRRQKDGVNCFSFVLNDLEVAESYLLEGKSCFFDTSNESSMNKGVRTLSLLNQFYEISQCEENSSKKFTMQIKKEQEALGNPLAINKSIDSVTELMKKNLLIFTSENHIEEGESDVDEEINECCLM